MVSKKQSGIASLVVVLVLVAFNKAQLDPVVVLVAPLMVLGAPLMVLEVELL
jgi:hypothetical protein